LSVEDVPKIKCTKCEDTYHQDCIGPVADKDTWTCYPCSLPVKGATWADGAVTSTCSIDNMLTVQSLLAKQNPNFLDQFDDKDQGEKMWKQCVESEIGGKSAEAQWNWYHHVKKQRKKDKKVKLAKESLYAAPEDVTTNQMARAVDFTRESRSEEKLCVQPFQSLQTHEFLLEKGSPVQDQIEQLTNTRRPVPCAPCLHDKKKKGKDDCFRTEEPLSIPDKTKAPVYIAFDNSSARIHGVEMRDAPNTIFIDGVEYNKTLLLIREEPVGGGQEHLTSLVETKQERGKWLR
jgi:hypothetical protein